jgi:hypothetical protein
MNNNRRSHRFQYLIIGVALLCARPVLADHLPDNELASGKADTVLCGFDPYFTPMKDILSKLGKPDRIDPRPTDKVNVTYQWSKGSLTIKANAYQLDGYLDRTPVYIEVSGSDPDGFCATGRGLKLGDSLADVRRFYGRYGVRWTGKGKRTITIQWNDESTVFVDLTKSGRVEAITALGEIE